MSGNVRSGYEDIDTLRDPSGVVVILSRRRSNQQISFAIMKEFKRDDVTEKTAFMQRRHIDGAIRLLRIAAEQMDKLEDERLAAERDGGGDPTDDRDKLESGTAGAPRRRQVR